MTHSMIRGYLKVVVLKALSEGPKSGYSLMKFVEEKTGSKPSPGSMYPLLDSLKSDNLVSVKCVGRTNEYSLTADGRQKLRLIEEKRAEFMNNFAEGIKVLSAMTGDDVSFPLEMIESMKKDEVPFKELNPEMDAFRDYLFVMMKQGKLKEKAPKIKKIFASALKELKS